MSKFNADTLQDMFSKVESGEITKEEAASYHQKSIGSINNYFQAKKAYEKGREVCAQNISVKAFTPWAVKYGNKGEPIYKQDPHPERKHTKKAKQITVEDLCPLEENNKPEEHEPAEHDSVAHNPLIEGAPAYFVNRTDDVICQRIADVAIQAISALLEIHKRGRD